MHRGGDAMNSRSRAIVVASVVILGMIAGFCAAYFLLVWAGICPREHLCATPVAHSALAFIVVPFSGMACAYLALRVLEKRSKMRGPSG
jgi:hypothetical protein